MKETSKEKQISYQSNVKEKPVPEKKKKILLAEDYEGNIVVAIFFLQDMGYETIVVNNGEQAIQKLQEEHFDLILMDVQMPVMNGFEATQKIRIMQKKGELYQVPIIGMTAHAFIGDKHKCLDAGMV